MGTAQLPLIFFIPKPGEDAVVVAESLASQSASTGSVPLDAQHLLQTLKLRRGFSRLKITVPFFSLDNPRAQAAFEGRAFESHLEVGFFGQFEKLAEPLFHALTSAELTCYSVWEKMCLSSWPKLEERKIDAGFTPRMMRVVERENSHCERSSRMTTGAISCSTDS